MKHLVMHLCPIVVFPLKKLFSQETLVNLVEKTKQEYMLHELKQNIMQHLILICGCQKVHMIFLHW
jgi:hypothetical protein